MYLLPEEPMQARLYDKRVGWFTIRQVDYGSEELKADEKRYIRRWKLIPKDIAAYARGELVEPVKPNCLLPGSCYTKSMGAIF